MTQYLPLVKMAERLKIEQTDSDVAMFFCLMYYGEMVTKLIVSGLVAGILDGKDRYQYALLHGLVRAGGIGDWAAALDEILIGPPSSNMLTELREEQRELNQRFPLGNWQNDAVNSLHSCFPAMGVPLEKLPNKVAVKLWFKLFAEFRNKTRGHAAPQGRQCSDVCSSLKNSIDLIIQNFSLFRRPWAYIRRNLSGKYRVTSLGGERNVFEYLTKEPRHSFPNGVYIFIDQPREVSLLHSDIEASDFLFPNGQFSKVNYETLSYITNQKDKAPSDKYILPVGQLPASETQGMGILEPIGKVFTNLPTPPHGYVPREKLESDLLEQLMLERHPIVTLTGAGGMGKTSLALHVLYSIAKMDRERFEIIIWFSARDIDLFEDGPRRVRPHLLTFNDFAREYVRLLNPSESNEKDFDPEKYLSAVLSNNPVGPTLFVFDNFETVSNPSDVYSWIDTFIRPPNKVLITTRIRDFSGDWPIQVTGMEEPEAKELVQLTSKLLGISSMITQKYILELFNESNGHPYVIKILLGEVAKAKRLLKLERIVATQDEILAALFERSYATLSPAAQRVFLVLCNWKSVIPELALEAILLRSERERIDVKMAVEELSKTSFIEMLISDKDEEVFVNVPLAAMLFGRRKLSASPIKAAVQADTELLLDFGASRPEDVRHGVLPRVRKLLKSIARRTGSDIAALEKHRPVLEFISRRVPAAWINVSDLYADTGTREGLENAASCLLRYLEQPASLSERNIVWKRLSELYRELNDHAGQIHALVEMCQVPGVPKDTISNAANTINGIYLNLKTQGKMVLDTEEKFVLVRKVADVMFSRIHELDATDLSRLAWLFLHIGEKERALEMAGRGCEIEPNNEYCQRFLSRLFN